MKIKFKTCPSCSGYGVLDGGKFCEMCGGVNTTMPGSIGSGEIMIDEETGQRVTIKRLHRYKNVE